MKPNKQFWHPCPSRIRETQPSHLRALSETVFVLRPENMIVFTPSVVVGHPRDVLLLLLLCYSVLLILDLAGD